MSRSSRFMSVATVVSPAKGTSPVTASTSVEGQRVDVALAVERLAPGLLGRRVAGGAEHRARRLGPGRLGEGPGQAEVGDAQPAVLAEEEVGGLDVAVDEAPAVGVVEAPAGLEPDEQRLGRGESRPRSSIARRLPPPRYSSDQERARRRRSSPQSKTAMMFGWLSAAAAWASAWKRRRKAASSASEGWSTLTATRRRSWTSSARYTVADAPVPTGATNR